MSARSAVPKIGAPVDYDSRGQTLFSSVGYLPATHEISTDNPFNRPGVTVDQKTARCVPQRAPVFVMTSSDGWMHRVGAGGVTPHKKAMVPVHHSFNTMLRLRDGATDIHAARVIAMSRMEVYGRANAHMTEMTGTNLDQGIDSEQSISPCGVFTIESAAANAVTGAEEIVRPGQHVYLLPPVPGVSPVFMGRETIAEPIICPATNATNTGACAMLPSMHMYALKSALNIKAAGNGGGIPASTDAFVSLLIGAKPGKLAFMNAVRTAFLDMAALGDRGAPVQWHFNGTGNVHYRGFGPVETRMPATVTDSMLGAIRAIGSAARFDTATPIQRATVVYVTMECLSALIAESTKNKQGVTALLADPSWALAARGPAALRSCVTELLSDGRSAATMLDKLYMGMVQWYRKAHGTADIIRY